MPNVKLPTRRWLLQQFPMRLVAVSFVAAILLTLTSSLIPRPVYQTSGLEVVRFGYPMPFLSQNRAGQIPERFPAFVAWTDGVGRVHLEWTLALVNVGFYLTAFALTRVLLRPSRKTSSQEH
jgi:hypothetical protein